MYINLEKAKAGADDANNRYVKPKESVRTYVTMMKHMSFALRSR